MITNILSWLLHHANRYTKEGEFYEIKKKLLAKYGKYIDDDVQFFDGCRCWTCGGSGVYTGYRWDMSKFTDGCRSCCGTGWYREPTYVILKRFQFGKYSFHQPWKSAYFKNPLPNRIPIVGYIEHEPSKNGKFATEILYLIYNRRMLGRGWYVSWWLPENYISNIFHIIRSGTDSIPFKNFIRKLRHKPKVYYQPSNWDDDSLPF